MVSGISCIYLLIIYSKISSRRKYVLCSNLRDIFNLSLTSQLKLKACMFTQIYLYGPLKDWVLRTVWV